MKLSKRFLYCAAVWTIVPLVSLLSHTSIKLSEHELTRANSDGRGHLTSEEEKALEELDLKGVDTEEEITQPTPLSADALKKEADKGKSKSKQKDGGFEKWKQELSQHDKRILRRILKKEEFKNLENDLNKAKIVLKRAKEKQKRREEEKLNKTLESNFILSSESPPTDETSSISNVD